MGIAEDTAQNGPGSASLDELNNMLGERKEEQPADIGPGSATGLALGLFLYAALMSVGADKNIRSNKDKHAFFAKSFIFSLVH